MGYLRRTTAAGLVLNAVLMVTGCSVSRDGTPTGGNPEGAATASAQPSSGASNPMPTTTSETPGQVPEDQQFSFDETAQYDDGLQIEIAGAVADKAKQTDRGAEATHGEIVIASIRIENRTAETFPAADVLVTAKYGDGKDAQIIIDKTNQLQSGFRGSIKKDDEQVATIGFAIPFSELAMVSFLVDPSDDVHDPVRFTGKVERG